MKKQFLFIAVLICAILFSCSKEKIGTPDNSSEMAPAANSQKGGGGSSVGNLNKGLLGWYRFDSTLKDATGLLADGVSTVNRVLYTTDRKGLPNHALYFNEGYGVQIFGVPLGTDMSVSVWVKQNIFPPNFVPMVEGSRTFSFMQQENIYQAAYWCGISGIPGQYYWSGQIDDKWHHLVATRDDISLKFYLDGTLIGSSPSPAGAGPYDGTSDYNLGWGYNNQYVYWKGGMDDLRIYRRVLSASEVTALFNL